MTPEWAGLPDRSSEAVVNNPSPAWVLESNGAENRFKGYENSKSDQKYLFPADFRLITNLFTLSESKLVHVAWSL